MVKKLEIDEIIHQKTRLAIMAHLVVVGETSFPSLKRTLGLSDGNISIHAGILEEKGFIEVWKSYEGKKPKTMYYITAAGRKAFGDYVKELMTVFLQGEVSGG